MVTTHHDFDTKRFMAPSPQTEQGYGRFLGSQLGNEDVSIMVAELDGVVVGYVFSSLEDADYMALRGPAGAIQDIIVDPAHRGQGIGAKLLDAAIEFLKSRGAPRVVLSTAFQNATAQRLFEKAGFRRTMVEMTRELT
jgi:ribosomal protein S18 acetylase RimI-like enzyme